MWKLSHVYPRNSIKQERFLCMDWRSFSQYYCQFQCCFKTYSFFSCEPQFFDLCVYSVYEWKKLYTYTCLWRSGDLVSFLSHMAFLLYVLRQGRSLKLKFSNCTWVNVHWASGIYLLLFFSKAEVISIHFHA